MFLCRLWQWAAVKRDMDIFVLFYDGGPVLFYEGEKDNEEENQDLQDEEEVIQQEWNNW